MALPPGFTQIGVRPADATPQGAAPTTQQLPAGFQEVRTMRRETPRDIQQRDAITKVRAEAYENAPEGAFRTVLTDEDPTKAAAITAIAQFTPNPIELGNILTRMDPNIGIQVSRDDAGRDKVVAINRVTNKIISLNNPGVSLTDVGQLTTAMTAAIPAGRAPSMGGRALAEGAIQALIEGGQQAMGGEFNPAEPLMAGGFSVAADAIPMAYRGLTTRNVAKRADIPGEQGQAVEDVAEMVRTMGRSTELAPSTQMQQARELVQPDQEIVEAARSLGTTESGQVLTESMPAGMMSSNQQYITLEAALSQSPASVLNKQRQQAIKDVANKADEFITRFGGDIDLASVDMEVKEQMLKNVEDLRVEARGMYKQIEGLVPPETFVDPLPVIRFLEGKARALGDISRLSPTEQRIYKAATSEDIPFTYGYLDQQRKNLGEIKRAQSGAYPGEKKFEIEDFEMAMLESQQRALQKINPEAATVFDVVRPLVAQRKELELINKSLMGSDLAKDIMPNLRTGLVQLSAGKLQKFNEVMEALPPELRARALVSAMNGAFTTGARTSTQLTPAGFSSWWENLSRKKVAKDALLKYMPEGAPEFLEALASVSKGMARSLAAVPPTGVTKAIGMFGSDQGFVSKVLGMTPVVGKGLSAVFEPKNVDMVEVATELLADPTFKRLATRGAAGQETTRLMEQLSTKPVFKQWMQTLPEQTSARIMTVGLGNYLFGQDEQ